MDEEITIPFYNDLLFKYFISDNDDKESMYLLKTIIESVTPLRCQALYVMNSELIPSRYKEKKAILDVRVQTDEGEFVNIEVQSTGMFESLHKRFQYYVFKNIATQVHSGDDYRKIKPVYMIILFMMKIEGIMSLLEYVETVMKNIMIVTEVFIISIMYF